MPEPQKIAPENFVKFFLLEKWDPFQGIATGIATAEALDRDKEILDYEKSKPYFEAWSDSVHKDSGGKSYGNVRRQHDDKVVAGKLNSIEFNDDAKMIRVEAKIVEPVTKDMLEEGVLTGFSIGGRYVDRKAQADGTTRYVADPCEISVVDRPALPGAVFQSVKSDGTTELRKFAKYEEPKEIAEEEHEIIEEHADEASPKLKEHLQEEEREEEKCEMAAKGVRYLVPDGKHLPVSNEDGKPNHTLMGAAWAALHGGYRGNKYEGPNKEKALAELKRLYESEGMDRPDASKTLLSETLEILKGGDIEHSNEEINALLKSIDQELKKMAEDKDITLDKAARHSIHQKITAAKAQIDAHMDHCAKAGKAMHAHLDGIAKVVGGGAESQAEGGEAEHVTHGDPDVVRQSPGASDTADKGAKYVSVGKDDKGNELFKRVEEDRPLRLSDIQELGKSIVKQVLDVQKAGVEAIGDRSKVTPFVKAATKEGDGDAANKANEPEKMTKEDWEAYAAGDRNAVAKAQRLTANKWQPVPSRIANREAARVGAVR